jgi:hypothetical protein
MAAAIMLTPTMTAYVLPRNLCPRIIRRVAPV